MSLVFLLVISLVSLVGTDLSLAELRKQRVLSQANAKMGMMVALGELQKHLGPDTRVSGTADLLDERVEQTSQFLQNKYDPNVTPSEGIDLNENGAIDKLPFGQRYWTGFGSTRQPTTTIPIIRASVPCRETSSQAIPPANIPLTTVDSILTGGRGGLAGQRKRRVSEEIGYLFLFRPLWEFIERFPRRARRDSCRRQASSLWIGNERLVDFEKVVKTDKFFGLTKPLTERSYHHPLIDLPDPTCLARRFQRDGMDSRTSPQAHL